MLGRKKKTHEEFMHDFEERQSEVFKKIEVVGIYNGDKEKIKCKCKIDDYEWDVLPSNLLRSRGCPKCARKRKTHEDFIKEFKEKQPKNFEKTEILGKYEKALNKILCKCKIDGWEWEATPDSLLRGTGCPKCAGSMKKTHEEFMKEFKEKQPKNFEKIEVLEKYTNDKNKIKCRCKIDGHEWYPRGGTLLRGSGCPKCVGKDKTHEEFINELKKIDPEIFEKIEILEEYTTGRSKIKCRCKIDEYEWYPRAEVLLRGSGCPKCAGNLRKTHEEFIEELKKINPNIEVVEKYIRSNVKIKCICKIDGYKWEVRPHNLLEGRGCPKCAKSSTSLFEQLIYEAFKEVLGEDKVLHRDKSLIGKELDIYIPSLKIAFEPGSWFWHKEKTWNDYDKYLLCKEKGVKLITIYDSMEDDFNLEFEYNVIKYKNEISKKEIKYFIEKQIKEIGIEYKINWEYIFEEAKINCSSINHEEFMKKFEEKYPENFKNIEVLERYIKSSEKIKCRCKIDGYEWEVTPNSLLCGRGCIKCRGRNSSEKYRKSHKQFMKEFKEEHPENFKNIEVLEKYFKNDKKIKCRCKIDGYEWEVRPISLLRGQGCPECGKKKQVETRRKNTELKKLKEKEKEKLNENINE